MKVSILWILSSCWSSLIPSIRSETLRGGGILLRPTATVEAAATAAAVKEEHPHPLTLSLISQPTKLHSKRRTRKLHTSKSHKKSCKSCHHYSHDSHGSHPTITIPNLLWTLSGGLFGNGNSGDISITGLEGPEALILVLALFLGQNLLGGSIAQTTTTMTSSNPPSISSSPSHSAPPSISISPSMRPSLPPSSTPSVSHRPSGVNRVVAGVAPAQAKFPTALSILWESRSPSPSSVMTGSSGDSTSSSSSSSSSTVVQGVPEEDAPASIPTASSIEATLEKMPSISSTQTQMISDTMSLTTAMTMTTSPTPSPSITPSMTPSTSTLAPTSLPTLVIVSSPPTVSSSSMRIVTTTPILSSPSSSTTTLPPPSSSSSSLSSLSLTNSPTESPTVETDDTLMPLELFDNPSSEMNTHNTTEFLSKRNGTSIDEQEQQEEGETLTLWTVDEFLQQFNSSKELEEDRSIGIVLEQDDDDDHTNSIALDWNSTRNPTNETVL